MEILRNIFGNLTSGLIRLAVAVGILAAVGIFIVKPALKSGENIAKESNEAFQHSFSGSNGAVPDLKGIEKTLNEVNVTVEREIKKSFHVAKKHGGPRSPNKLIHCIQRADGDVHRIQRCAARF